MFESSNQFLTAADLYQGAGAKYPPFEHTPLGQFYPGATGAGNGGQAPPASSSAAAVSSGATAPDNGKLLDGLNSFGLGSVAAPYPASQYQHLLVAN